MRVSAETRASLFPTAPDMPSVVPDMRVGFILSPRFTLLAFAGFIDGLRHAADEADFSRQIYCHWKVVAPTPDPIAASCGVEVLPHEVFPDPRTFDHLVVVGGLLPFCLEHPPETFSYLRTAHDANVSIVGLCTGSFIIAKAGLLDDRRCAVDAPHLKQMQGLFPRVRPDSDSSYVEEENIVTCRGGTTALDLVIALIEGRCGRARAIKGVTALHMDPIYAAHRLPHRPYVHLTASGNRKVERAVEFMEKHIAGPLSIATLSRQLDCSPRELNRLFSKYAHKPPSAVWRDMRLEHGHWLLVNSSRTVTQIALECGFSDGAHFSRWFRKTYGEAPVAFRDRRRQV